MHKRTISLPNHIVTSEGLVFTEKGKPLKIHTNKPGNLRFVTKGNKRYYVHVLVCEAFNGPKPTSDATVRHKDKDKGNNTPANLAWDVKVIPAKASDRENLLLQKIEQQAKVKDKAMRLLSLRIGHDPMREATNEAIEDFLHENKSDPY